MLGKLHLLVKSSMLLVATEATKQRSNISHLRTEIHGGCPGPDELTKRQPQNHDMGIQSDVIYLFFMGFFGIFSCNIAAQWDFHGIQTQQYDFWILLAVSQW